MRTQQQNLCAVCQAFNVQQLLLTAASPDGVVLKTGPQKPSKAGTVHAAVPTFFPHQPNLTSLKNASESCGLCLAIWKDYSRQRGPSELTALALTQGLGGEQIYVGTPDWDASINAVPSVVVRQQSLNAAVQRSKQIACFEVCAEYGVF